MSENPKGESNEGHDEVPKNEIKVSSSTRLGAVLKYVWFLLVKDKKFSHIVMRAAGPAIGNVVALNELI